MLINRASVKRLALDLARQRFQGTQFEHKYTRVSKEFLDEIEASVRRFTGERIRNMPTMGKTIR